jgi:hypothetical protein
MSEQLEQAVEVLTSTFQSLELIARALQVDAQEVADALQTVTPDTAEQIALLALAKCNPLPPAKPSKSSTE